MSLMEAFKLSCPSCQREIVTAGFIALCPHCRDWLAFLLSGGQ